MQAEAEFHSVMDTYCEQEVEILDFDEQVDWNPSSNSSMVSKVTQWYNGAPISTFIYTSETFRAICVKAFLPEPIHDSFFLNEYDCMLQFPTEFELCKITVDLQQTMQWFGYDVVITLRWLLKISWMKLNRVERNPIHLPVWMSQRNILKLSLSLPNKLNNR